jgi:hypothetical protein
MKIENLTIQEAEEKIDQASLHVKQIEIKKTELQQTLNKQKDEKTDFKNKKSTKLKSIQEEIKKQRTPAAKESKRKQKVRESNSFDNRIKSKENEIRKTRDKITEINSEKAYINKIKELFKQHVKQLKKTEL